MQPVGSSESGSKLHGSCCALDALAAGGPASSSMSTNRYMPLWGGNAFWAGNAFCLCYLTGMRGPLLCSFALLINGFLFLWRPSKPKGYLEDDNKRCGDM